MRRGEAARDKTLLLPIKDITARERCRICCREPSRSEQSFEVRSIRCRGLPVLFGPLFQRYRSQTHPVCGRSQGLQRAIAVVFPCRTMFPMEPADYSIWAEPLDICGAARDRSWIVGERFRARG